MRAKTASGARQHRNLTLPAAAKGAGKAAGIAAASAKRPDHTSAGGKQPTAPGPSGPQQGSRTGATNRLQNVMSILFGQVDVVESGRMSTYARNSEQPAPTAFKSPKEQQRQVGSEGSGYRQPPPGGTGLLATLPLLQSQVFLVCAVASSCFALFAWLDWRISARSISTLRSKASMRPCCSCRAAANSAIRSW